MVETLAAAGVERIYGIVGDSLKASPMRCPRWRHSMAACPGTRKSPVRGRRGCACHRSFAVCPEVAVLAICTCHGLFDCHRSRLPVWRSRLTFLRPDWLGLFPETHPEQLFRECSSYSTCFDSRTDAPRTRNRRASARSMSAVYVMSFPATSAQAGAKRGRAVADGTRARAVDCRALRSELDKLADPSQYGPARHVALRQRLRGRA